MRYKNIFPRFDLRMYDPESNELTTRLVNEDSNFIFSVKARARSEYFTKTHEDHGRARNFCLDLLVLWGKWSKFFTRPYSS